MKNNTILERPLVSIIIPVYNGADYLKEAIDSALNQDYDNFEVIVINDGSTDEGATEKIALSYGTQIRYFCKENGGVASALNFGISKMKGEYFSWLSHDDYYYSDKLSGQINALQQREISCGVVFSAYDVFDMKSQILTHFLPHESFASERLERSVFSLLEGFLHFCTMLVPKQFLLECGGFQESLKATQDDEMCFRLLRKYPVIYSAQPVCVVRVHENQGSNTLSGIQQEKEKTWSSFMERLTEKEKITMYGSLKSFYHAMRCFFFSTNMNSAYYRATKLFEIVQYEDVGNKGKLKDYLKVRFQREFKEICVFGTGRYGVRTAVDLLAKGINITCFCDNNKKVYGKEIVPNIFCESLEIIKQKKTDTLVIISLKQKSEVMAQLEKEQFPYVILREEIREVLIESEIERMWEEI